MKVYATLKIEVAVSPFSPTPANTPVKLEKALHEYLSYLKSRGHQNFGGARLKVARYRFRKAKH